MAVGSSMAADGLTMGYSPSSSGGGFNMNNNPWTPGSGSSAKGVGSTSSLGSSITSDISSALDRIFKLTEQNTARSEQQAAELRDWQERQNKIAMEFNSAEAAKNRDWQQMMSDTAHQREIRDLQAAGLNPVLSAMGGNGASVTSGATASGVTSSGSRGEVDTSATQALVGLLGTLWSAQTQLESQRISAQNNLAIAEKNNSASELIARIYTEQSREASQLAAETSLKTSEISAAVSELVSRINANASYYSSSMSHQNAILYSEANKVVADMQVGSANRNTLINGLVDLAQSGIGLYGTLRGQDISASSAFDVAKIGFLKDIITGSDRNRTSKSVANKNYQSNILGSLFRMLPFLG